MNEQNMTEIDQPISSDAQIVLPSDAEIINGIFDYYTKEIASAETKVVTALDTLRKNLMDAERNNIAIMAQKALVTAMATDYKNAKAPLGVSKV